MNQKLRFTPRLFSGNGYVYIIGSRLPITNPFSSHFKFRFDNNVVVKIVFFFLTNAKNIFFKFIYSLLPGAFIFCCFGPQNRISDFEALQIISKWILKFSLLETI